MKRFSLSLLCFILVLSLLCGCSLFGETVPVGADTDAPDKGSDTLPVSDTEPSPSDTVETTPAVTEPPALVIPNLIGMDVSETETLFLPGVEVIYHYTSYPAPVGTVVDATFSGITTETEFHIDPDSTLTLHVSTGTARENVTVAKDDRVMYLTFDDGPILANTGNILDVLDEYNIKATFFLVGYAIDRNPDLVREIHARGHKIGCHSYSHQYATIYESAENMKADVEKWEAAIEKALGFVPEERLFRCPGGSSLMKNEEVLQFLLEKGFRIFDWNSVNDDCMMHTRPAGMTPEDFMKDRVISSTAYSLKLPNVPHIMLMHDTYSQTADLLGWTIEYLAEQGFTFGTLDALPGNWRHGQ